MLLCEVTTAHFMMALKYARVVLKSSNAVGESSIARLLSMTTTTWCLPPSSPSEREREREREKERRGRERERERERGGGEVRGKSERGKEEEEEEKVQTQQHSNTIYWDKCGGDCINTP